MENWMELFQQTALFQGFSQDEIASALLCLEGTVQRYRKKGIIFHEEDPLRAVGIVLSGTVYLCKSDEEGGQAIFSEMLAGDIVGETALQSGRNQGGDGVSYSAYAAEDSEILFIQMDKIVRPMGEICALRSKVIENLLSLIVSNNRVLYRKLDLVAQKSLRQRILHYLELEAKRNASRSFSIPFSRADFADYLMADRSALSRELCRMADEGLIRFNRNRFELLESVDALNARQ